MSIMNFIPASPFKQVGEKVKKHIWIIPHVKKVHWEQVSVSWLGKKWAPSEGQFSISKDGSKFITSENTFLNKTCNYTGSWHRLYRQLLYHKGLHTVFMFHTAYQRLWKLVVVLSLTHRPLSVTFIVILGAVGQALYAFALDNHHF